jgi:hypothetical protein
MVSIIKKPGYRFIGFRASYTKKGKTIYAKDYGLRGFPIWVKV